MTDLIREAFGAVAAVARSIQPRGDEPPGAAGCGVGAGFAVVRHVGRRSGRVYETPLAVFRRGDTVTIALTYGAKSEWVKNVLAAGGCELRTRGKTLRLIDPRVVRDDRRRGVPAVVRVVLRVMGVAEFLVSRYELQLAKSP